MTNPLPKVPERNVVDGVALVSDRTSVATGVTFCFTERSGGVSRAPYESLNLGMSTGDAEDAVLENRRRALGAAGCADLFDDLIVPRQVHGDTVQVVRARAFDRAPLDAGCDAVVCTVSDQAVMLLFADCVPVVLAAPGGFAVAHSGWRGTLAGIAAKTAVILARECECATSEVNVWIGPHISGPSYEVDDGLLDRFCARFGAPARCGERHLDLSACIAAALAEVGVDGRRVVDCGEDTATQTDRFFSHRAEHGLTGRHAAIAYMRT